MTEPRLSSGWLDLIVPVACVILGLTADAAAAESHALARTKYTNGAAVRRVFVDVVVEANHWTVRINAGEELAAFGTIVRQDGFIISKASQLHGELTVRLADGRQLPADYVGYNADHDLALLKVEADGLPTVQWQDEDDPLVGGWVITPDQQGAPNSVGVISVSRRRIPRVREPAILGITMKIDTSPVVVQEVADGSGAEQAGLQPEDIIHQVDDVIVSTPGALKYEISRRSPGDSIQLRIERDGRRQTLRATLTHPFGEFQSRIAMQNHMGGDLSKRRTGFPTVLQHDSVLRPEQCGGPLVDLSGRAVGINIARAGRTESYAIPDDIVRPLIDELLSGKYPPPGGQEPTVAADLGEEGEDPPRSDTSRQ